jgi:hypothetical protein
MFLESEPGLKMPVIMPRYYWFFNPVYHCLCVFPLMQNESLAAQRLWKFFIKSLPFFESSQWHSFLYHPESVNKLIKELQPKSVWLCVEPCLISENISDRVFISPPPEHWLTKPLIKKHVWQIWQNILET